MFATGIENSIPTINGGTTRVDEMEECGHYEHWREDFDCVEELGIQFLRYGPPLHTHLPRARQVRLGVRRRDLRRAASGATSCRSSTSATSACPTGSAISRTPTSRSCSPTMPRAFAERFPWVQLYTPVNEMFICAIVLGQVRLVERAADERPRRSSPRSSTSSRPTCWRCRRSSKRRPDAIFIQSESSEYFHADSPAAIGPAEIMNARRFLSLDLNYGRRVDCEMYEYLLDNGMTREEYHFFLDNRLQAALHHGQRLLRHQRAPRASPTAAPRRRARSSATTRSPGSITTATACR